MVRIVAIVPSLHEARCGYSGPRFHCNAWKRWRSVTDLVADAVLLLVQQVLLIRCDVAIVEAGHGALLKANRMILGMQRRGLAGAQFALHHFLMNAIVLIGEAVVDLLATRMVVLPQRLRRRGGIGRAEHGKGNCDHREFAKAGHDSPHSVSTIFAWCV